MQIVTKWLTSVFDKIFIIVLSNFSVGKIYKLYSLIKWNIQVMQNNEQQFEAIIHNTEDYHFFIKWFCQSQKSNKTYLKIKRKNPLFLTYFMIKNRVLTWSHTISGFLD